MSDLYSVRLHRKRIITEFDAGGYKMSERMELIPQIFLDLPYQTACAYKQLFPTAGVIITRQDGEVMPGRTFAPSVAVVRKTTAAVSPAKATPSHSTSAAATGDLSAAISS